MQLFRKLPSGTSQYVAQNALEYESAALSHASRGDVRIFGDEFDALSAKPTQGPRHERLAGSRSHIPCQLQMV